MIRLQCSNCGQTLEVDDAFAGGVCRCRHCGTIQTVPADAPRAQAETVGAVVGSRALYRREEHRGDRPSGLDELADVVASSGAISSGLHRSNRVRAQRRVPVSNEPDETERQVSDRRLMIAIGVAVVLAVVAAALALALLTGGADRDDAGLGDSSDAAEFAGLPVGRQVVFVVDRGKSTQEAFSRINDLILETVSDLPPGSEFQIVYWPRPDLDDQPPAIPSRALRSTSSDAVAAARRAAREISTGGSTVAPPAVELALDQRPDTVVLITGKSWALAPTFTESILALWQRLPDDDRAVIHTIAVGDATDGMDRPLHRIAETSGGEFRGFSNEALETLLEQTRDRN